MRGKPAWGREAGPCHGIVMFNVSLKGNEHNYPGKYSDLLLPVLIYITVTS